MARLLIPEYRRISIVRAALDSVESDVRSLLERRYFDGLSVEEIAAQDHCDCQKCRVQLIMAEMAMRLQVEKVASFQGVQLFVDINPGRESSQTMPDAIG